MRGRTSRALAWMARVAAGLACFGPCGWAADGPAAPAGAPEDPTPVRVVVQGTEFRVYTASGREVPQEDLVGAELTARDENGVRAVVRIDSVALDPGDPSGEVRLYGLSTRDPGAGGWREACEPGPDGSKAGFPIGGSWTPDGRHVADGSFILTCASGAIGKCVRYGYKPWKDGRSLWDYHQACTRMVRADYCGDGRSWTRNGTLIDVFDGLGIQTPDPGGAMPFEAAWGKDGAACVARTRVPDRLTLAALLALCPEKPKLAPADCTEDAARRLPEALVMNRSPGGP